jgi:uncharacterized protein
MKFNPKARLDRSQIRDRRGARRSGGMPGLGGGGLPIPMGGGIGGIIVLVLLFVIATQCGVLDLGGGNSSSDAGTSLEECVDGTDTDKQECRILADVNAIQAFWSDALPKQAGVKYEPSEADLLNGPIDTGCGTATPAQGPFYCPVDKTVYLDPTFFEDMLQRQLGASGGEFQEAYVIAHEYGHHVQDLLGTLGKHQSSATGPTSESVRIELQADCYAGIWAHYATTATDASGEPLILEITDQDIKDAINAATAVGDDRIQQQTSGRVNPEQWTHGSAAERVHWFQTGYDSGQLDSCDTFAAGAL